MGIQQLGLRLVVGSLLAIAGLAAPAPAALVSISSVTPVSSPNYDLTNVYGTFDWAYWNQTGNPLAATVAPANEKSGASLIGSMSVVGGGTLRGTTSGNATAYNFIYGDGTSTPSGTVTGMRGVFNTQIGPTAVGTGVQVTVTAPSANPFNIYLWGTAFQGTVSLTANVGSGAAVVTDSSYSGTGDRFPGRLYTILVTPDAAGQTVNLQYVMSSVIGADGSANVSVSGIAIGHVAAIPEPGSLALLLGGSSLLGWSLLQRRRTQVAS